VLEQIAAPVALFIKNTITALGYPGIVLLMAIESAGIPLPSEIIMPFGGFLVFEKVFVLWGVALAGAIGCVAGSIPLYYIGLYGGRPLILKYGKWALISPHELEWADRVFARYGEWVVFAGRLLPVIRTYIAFPAGVSKMNMPRFIAYTFVGSLIWCWALAYAGVELGENWDQLRGYFQKFDVAIAAVGVLLLAAFIWSRIRALRAISRPPGS
jgi:membrane protein DedA with SNARE-associated domain